MKKSYQGLLGSSAVSVKRRSQQGAALLVVLSLLTVSLMLGLSSMQSSQIDERLAGNYRAATEAQMYAESAAASLLFEINEPSGDVIIASQQDIENYDWGDKGLRWSMLKDFSSEPFAADSCYVSDDEIACYMELPDDFQGWGFPSGNYIIAFGAIGDSLISESLPVMVRLYQENGYGILAGGDISIDNNTHFIFSGRLHANKEYVYDDKFVCNGTCTDENDGVFVEVPVFDFDAYVEQVKNNVSTVNLGDDDCSFNIAGDLGGVVYYCGGNINVEKGSYSNGTLVAEGDIEFKKNTVLSDMAFVSKGEIEYDDSGNFEVIDSYFLAKEEIEIDAGGNSDFSGWFYSDDEIDIDIKGAGQMSFDGILIAQEDVKIETKGTQNFNYKPIPPDGKFRDIFFSGTFESDPFIDFWVH